MGGWVDERVGWWVDRWIGGTMDRMDEWMVGMDGMDGWNWMGMDTGVVLAYERQ